MITTSVNQNIKKYESANVWQKKKRLNVVSLVESLPHLTSNVSVNDRHCAGCIFSLLCLVTSLRTIGHITDVVRQKPNARSPCSYPRSATNQRSKEPGDVIQYRQMQIIRILSGASNYSVHNAQ